MLVDTLIAPFFFFSLPPPAASFAFLAASSSASFAFFASSFAFFAAASAAFFAFFAAAFSASPLPEAAGAASADSVTGPAEGKTAASAEGTVHASDASDDITGAASAPPRTENAPEECVTQST